MEQVIGEDPVWVCPCNVSRTVPTGPAWSDPFKELILLDVLFSPDRMPEGD
jgi:hypothetical protein